MKGVIPAAGLGTRLLPATKAQPKEMLPIVDKPTIQYVVEEAAAAGLSEVVIVVGPTKAAIAEHFSADPEQVHRFEKAGHLPALVETLDLVRRIPIRFVTQREPLGLGHAIYQARHVVGNEPFAVLLGDDIIRGKTPAVSELIGVFDEAKHSVIGVQKTAREELSKYGVIKVAKEHPRRFELADIVEKPKVAEAPSDYAVVGRYVFTPAIFECLRETPPGNKGEIQLTDAIRLLLGREPVSAFALTGQRLDTGGKLEWLSANVEMGLLDPTVGAAFRMSLERLLKQKRP